MTSRTEEIYILYATKTKKSENAAKSFAEDITTKLSPEAIQKLTGTKDEITVDPTLMMLDEFLDLKSWKRLCVIFVSSHGRGDSPPGGFRFRDLCDTLEDKDEKILDGIRYAMCGLGDSNFKTFFENPKTLDKGLSSAGAERVGPLGKADACGKEDDSQANVIAQWKEEIWKPLAEVIIQEPLEEEKLNVISEKVASMSY